MFCCTFYEIFKNKFTGHLWTTASQFLAVYKDDILVVKYLKKIEKLKDTSSYIITEYYKI